MKKVYIRIFIILLTWIIFTGNGYAQNTGTDTVLVTQQLKSTRTYYDAHIGDQSRLLNGIKYVPYPPGIYEGNAYYITSEPQNAYLRYDDADLYNVPVLFDMYKNLLVMRNRQDDGYVNLLNVKLNKFIIANHTFIKIDSNEVLKPGFYDQLYNGPTQILVKRGKTLDQEILEYQVHNIFKAYNNIYLRKNGVYNAVSGKKDLLKLLKDKKKDLDAYIKTNSLSFDKENTEQSILKLTVYYDQLTR